MQPEKTVCRSRSDRAEHGAKDWFNIGKGMHQGYLYIVTCLFNLYAEYIMQNARLDETQAGIQIAIKKWQ